EDVENRRHKLRPHYNRAGALERVALERVAPGGGVVSDTFVERIAYNAKGQRVLIAYGNGVMTRYAYDPATFRLVRMRTAKYLTPPPVPNTYRPNGSPFQVFNSENGKIASILAITDQVVG